MSICRICGDELSVKDKFRGTCQDCEKAIQKLIKHKIEKHYSYPKKIKLKI